MNNMIYLGRKSGKTRLIAEATKIMIKENITFEEAVKKVKLPKLVKI